MQNGLPPWHMWGDKKTVVLTQDTGLNVARQSEQLVRINYARPETWRWFFSARLIETTAAGPINVFVNWNLTFGVGRSSTNFPAFEQYLFSTAAIPLNVSDIIFSSTVSGRLRLQGVPAANQPAPNVVETISAQDIQLQADFVFSSANAGERAVVEVSAYFSPNVHVRPEWLTRVGLFPGGEASGK